MSKRGASASRAARTNPAIAAGAGATSETSSRSSRAAARSSSRALSTSNCRPPSRATALAGRRAQTACRGLMNHLFVPVLLALELDGGVLDGEPVFQERAGVGEDLVVAAAAGRLASDHDVAGERDEAAGDGPDVQVVDGGDPRDCGERRRDLGDGDVAGGAFEEDVHRLAAEADRAPDDGAGDEEADD